VERISRCLYPHPLRAVLQQTRVQLTPKLLAAIPALRHGLAKQIDLLPSKVALIGAEAILTNSLKTINLKCALREIDRGSDFQTFTPHHLTCFGQAVAVMKFTLAQRGITELVFTGRQGTSVVLRADQLIADNRRVTAGLAVNEGKLELSFSIYRHFDSLLDYVQVAVPLPGLEVNSHVSLPNTYFLTAV
jgi:hypothetical protein